MNLDDLIDMDFLDEITQEHTLSLTLGQVSECEIQQTHNPNLKPNTQIEPTLSIYH